jgi:hypothetical protein
MILSMEVVRARKGDCLMIHFGSAADPHLLMVDGGPSGVYGPHLKPRIEALRAARGLAADRPLDVDLLVVSHVDDDHIRGILDLTKELIEADMDHRPQLIRIGSLWHNSFDNLIGNKPDELTAAMQSQFGPASLDGDLPEDIELDVADDLAQKDVLASLMVLSSIKQGAQLRSDASRLNIETNVDFDGKLIIADKDLESVDMGAGLELTVIGPMKADLVALHDKHEKWLKDLVRQGKSPHDVLSAYVDKSVPNLSSLVLMAEAEGKTMLLTGDARGDKIIEGLQLVGLLGPDDHSPLHVNLLKVPHHGSDNNMETGFFQRITADHYVFSGDGEHGNPERATLEMLWEARGDAPYTVHLTYPVGEIDVERKNDWKREQAKEKKRREKNPNQVVREDWSMEVNGLGGLFDKEKDFAKKVRIVADQGPHMIDLLDPATR